MTKRKRGWLANEEWDNDTTKKFLPHRRRGDPRPGADEKRTDGSPDEHIPAEPEPSRDGFM